jgi:hypothetical protein
MVWGLAAGGCSPENWWLSHGWRTPPGARGASEQMPVRETLGATVGWFSLGILGCWAEKPEMRRGSFVVDRRSLVRVETDRKLESIQLVHREVRCERPLLLSQRAPTMLQLLDYYGSRCKARKYKR